jgi:hypothetical protein
MRPLAVALLFWASAAGAAEGEADWAATRGASAEEQLRARLEAAVRRLGNTDTKYLVGGYVQLDAIAMHHRQDGDEQDTMVVSATPFTPADSAQRLSVRQSQINWLSRTPTGHGPLWTRVEVNLFGDDGEMRPSVNQLFAKLGDAVLVGKTYSTFMDENALPTTADYNGPSGVTFVRQSMLRGSVGIANGWKLEGALEQPQADFIVGGTLAQVSSHAERPDLAARVRAEGEWGSAQLSALSRRLSVSATGATGGTLGRRIEGTGLSFSGAVDVREGDTFLWQLASGKGIGRYFNDPLSAVAVEADGLDPLRMTGATLYYQHKWSAQWMSVAGGSTLRVDSEGAPRRTDTLNRLRYLSANLLYRASPTLVFGGEVIAGEAAQVGGETAGNVRLQFSVRTLIF